MVLCPTDAGGGRRGILCCRFHYEWMPALLLILFAVFFLPVFLRARIYTAPQYLEQRFGRAPRLAFSAMLLLTSMLVDAPGSLYAGAMVLKTLLPGVSIWIGTRSLRPRSLAR
ncbi:MAG: hypothetical protein WBN10_19840 [Polyangiales bacterium]